MRVVVEFDMVDMSMHKHETFFRHILKKYGFGIRGIKILEPDERVIKDATIDDLLSPTVDIKIQDK